MGVGRYGGVVLACASPGRCAKSTRLSLAPGAQGTRSLRFDYALSATTVTDAPGNSRTRTMTATPLGPRTSELHDAAGGTYAFGYNGSGGITSARRPDGIQFSFLRNGLGREVNRKVTQGSATRSSSTQRAPPKSARR